MKKWRLPKKIARPKQMNKELSIEEIIAKHTQSNILPVSKEIHAAMQEYADQQAKKEAIDAMDWIRKQRPDIFYGSPTSEQLYELFNQQK